MKQVNVNNSALSEQNISALKNHYQQQLDYIVENNERFIKCQYRFWSVTLIICCLIILGLLVIVGQRYDDISELKMQLKEQTEIVQTCTMSIDHK